MQPFDPDTVTPLGVLWYPYHVQVGKTLCGDCYVEVVMLESVLSWVQWSGIPNFVFAINCISNRISCEWFLNLILSSGLCYVDFCLFAACTLTRVHRASKQLQVWAFHIVGAILEIVTFFVRSSAANGFVPVALTVSPHTPAVLFADPCAILTFFTVFWKWI